MTTKRRPTKRRRTMIGGTWKNQVKLGVKTESEHAPTINFIRNYYKKNKKFPTNKMIYKKIALNHLAENPKYYSKLKQYKL